MKNTKTKFYCSFYGIIILLISLFIFYRCVFDGDLSRDISDWTAFVNLFNGVGTLLFAALNVWVVYELTIRIAERDEKHKMYELKKDMLNNFVRTIYMVFTPDISDPICKINANNLNAVYLKLQRMSKVYSLVNNVFMDNQFVAFIEEFRCFCLDYQQEDSAEAMGKNMEEEAYKLFMKAIEIEDEIIKDINSI